MPRNVRNFWIELTVDGKKTKIATGPARKDGGFDLTIKMRNKGGILQALDILGRVHGDVLLLRYVDQTVPHVHSIRTER